MGDTKGKVIYQIRTIGRGRRARYEVWECFDFGGGEVLRLECEGSFDDYGQASALRTMLMASVS